MPSVCGSVLDHNGNPLSSVSVVIGTFWVGFSDETGRFCINNVKDGVYKICALHRNYPMVCEEIAVSGDIELSIQMGW